MNVVLEQLRQRRAEAVAAMESVLEQVTDRDLSEAERSLLETTRERIAIMDQQIEPLVAYEEQANAHREGTIRPTAVIPATPRSAGGPVAECPYRSAGAFIVDYMRARGIMDRGVNDAEAASRIAAAYNMRADQTTADTPGILPTPIVGGVVNIIDANRPLIMSLGGSKPLGGIPGKTFSRPSITQHVTVGKQTGEKVALPSQKMSIQSIPFNKETWGGYVDISRQDIDWTSPGAWDILVTDLADVYSTQTEAAVSTAFKTAATGTPVILADGTLAGWVHALYTAAMRSYNAGQRMPDRIWCSLNVWAALGSLVDVQRVVMPVDGNNDTAAGSASLASFRGDVLGLPRVVVPKLPSGTCIIGPSNLYEVYEEVIGLLSVIEPSILGVQVAYGGYLAYGSLFGGAFVPIDTTAAALPTAADDDGSDEGATTNGGTKAASGK